MVCYTILTFELTIECAQTDYWYLLSISFRGHANLLGVVPILVNVLLKQVYVLLTQVYVLLKQVQL